jgi:hypothetical protein
VVVGAAGAPALRGVVETAAQLEALKTIVSQEVRGAVTIDVHTADEAITVLPQPGGPPQFAKPVASRQPAGEALIRTWLKGRNLTGDAASAELLRISNQVVRLANEAWIESWALQRLVERFGPKERLGLSLAGRARLFEMAQWHFAALEKALAGERDLLMPILGDEPSTAATEAPVRLFAEVARLSALIQDTFAGGGEEAEEGVATRLRESCKLALSSASAWGSTQLHDWEAFPVKVTH